tara:strand:- start:615 stop:1094 length:480 start_codon:yes stop_codon:yes gene_type:complete
MGFFSDRWDDFKSGAKRGFITVLPGGAAYLMWDDLGNVEVVNAGTEDARTGQEVLIESTADQTADALGITDLNPETLLNKFGDVLGDAASAIGNATIQVAKFIGPAIVDGVENTYDYIRGKLRGREPDIIAAVTVGALTVLAGVYLFNAAKRGTMTYTE